MSTDMFDSEVRAKGGCYCLLSYQRKAKQLGDILIFTLDTNASVMYLLKLGCREALAFVLKSGTMKSFQNQGLSTLCTGLWNTLHYECTMLLQGFSVRTVENHPCLNLPSTSIITIVVTIVIIWCTGWIYYMPFQFPSPLARQKKKTKTEWIIKVNVTAVK